MRRALTLVLLLGCGPAELILGIARNQSVDSGSDASAFVEDAGALDDGPSQVDVDICMSVELDAASQWPAMQDPTCGSCVVRECCFESFQCGSGSECVTFGDCYQNCTVVDASPDEDAGACSDQCLPSGATPYFEFAQCGRERCGCAL